MKQILILLFACMGFFASAQNHKEQIDKLVSKEQVKTGILYNRVVPFAGLQALK